MDVQSIDEFICCLRIENEHFPYPKSGYVFVPIQKTTSKYHRYEYNPCGDGERETRIEY